MHNYVEGPSPPLIFVSAPVVVRVEKECDRAQAFTIEGGRGLTSGVRHASP